MENQTEKKWYQKPTSIIILLIFFFPVGLYLMWKNELWTKQIRWVVSSAIVIVVIANANNNNSDNSNYQSDFSRNNNNQNCIGNQDCISKIRENFSNTGKTILGEEYIGNGKFGISFMDSQHPGAAYNATVSSDCNCNIINSDVSTIR
jgi:hypothetical protein